MKNLMYLMVTLLVFLAGMLALRVASRFDLDYFGFMFVLMFLYLLCALVVGIGGKPDAGK